MPARRSAGLGSRSSDRLLRGQAADLSRYAGASPRESSAGALKIAGIGLLTLRTSLSATLRVVSRYPEVIWAGEDPSKITLGGYAAR